MTPLFIIIVFLSFIFKMDSQPGPGDAGHSTLNGRLRSGRSWFQDSPGKKGLGDPTSREKTWV
jgi:hypothetical protein